MTSHSKSDSAGMISVPSFTHKSDVEFGFLNRAIECFCWADIGNHMFPILSLCRLEIRSSGEDEHMAQGIRVMMVHR